MKKPIEIWDLHMRKLMHARKIVCLILEMKKKCQYSDVVMITTTTKYYGGHDLVVMENDYC